MELKFMQNSSTTIKMGEATIKVETTMTRVDLYKGNTLIGSAGVKNPNDFDYDYRGQLMANAYNLSPNESLKIKDGDRICQIKLQPVWHMNFEEVSELSETKRGAGGFGSTGK